MNFQVLTLDWRVLERCQQQKCARDILPKRVFWWLTSNCMQNFCNLLLLLCCFISRYRRHLETDSPLISRQSTFHEYHKYCVTRAPFILLGASWLYYLSKSLSQLGIGVTWPDLHFFLSQYWPNNINNRLIVTQYHQVPTIAALYWPSTSPRNARLSQLDPVSLSPTLHHHQSTIHNHARLGSSPKFLQHALLIIKCD